VRAAVEVMFQRMRQCLTAGQVLINPHYAQNPGRGFIASSLRLSVLVEILPHRARLPTTRDAHSIL